jgi:hypothetical protein
MSVPSLCLAWPEAANMPASSLIRGLLSNRLGDIFSHRRSYGLPAWSYIAVWEGASRSSYLLHDKAIALQSTFSMQPDGAA